MPRTVVPSWFFEQSAVIPFRWKRQRLEVLLITSRRKKRWIFPKGVIDPGMSPRASARKEAREEAGIEGRIEKEALGEYTYEKWNGTCRVTVYAMQVSEVHDRWDEEDERTRRWVHAERAETMLDSPDLRRLLSHLRSRLSD